MPVDAQDDLALDFNSVQYMAIYWPILLPRKYNLPDYKIIKIVTKKKMENNRPIIIIFE